MESILNSIKKLLGITEEQKHFDADIIMHINSVFSVLNQLGVGPAEGFRIDDDIDTWNDFIQDSSKLELVKSYMYLRVRILFNPPSSAAVMNAIKETITEYESRLNIIAESQINSEENQNE